MDAYDRSLQVHPDGTAVDPRTGLMWMVPFVGQGWAGGEAYGRAELFSWHEATSSFGRARNIGANSLDCNWSGPKERFPDKTPYFTLYPLGQESYTGYRTGRRQWEFAGFGDWRLPTIEECWSLSTVQLDGTLPTDHATLRMWTANPSTRSVAGVLRALVDGIGNCAWLFRASTGACEGFGDMHTDGREAVRLVRAGTLFEAVR